MLTRMSIEQLRPWEYWEMSAWDYDRLAHARDALQDAQARYPDRSGE